jgi:hypothetical protein
LPFEITVESYQPSLSPARAWGEAAGFLGGDPAAGEKQFLTIHKIVKHCEEVMKKI